MIMKYNLTMITTFMVYVRPLYACVNLNKKYIQANYRVLHMLRIIHGQ